ncbi:hypothetical protein Tco_0522825 [Tanacetum coccineum]
MSSNEALFEVTYTSISSDYEEPSDTGSPGVIVYGYDGLPMHPVDPPSPDYVSGPEEPEQAPPSLDYVLGLEYPEYLAPSDAEIPVDYQTHAADASPTALSPSNIADSNPEDESEDGPMDYPTDGEEHQASVDSIAVPPAVDPVPSAEETEPFETDESAATLPPPHAYRTTARMSIRAQAHIPFPSEAEVTRLLDIPTPPPSLLTPLSSPLPQIPSPPFVVPSPPTTSPTYTEAPLGFRAAGIQLRVASPLASPISPPTYHPLPLPAPSTSRESSTAAVARQPDLGAARTTDYGFFDMEGAPMTLEEVNARVTELDETYERDTQDLYAHLDDA